MSGLRVAADRGRCCASGMCALTAPDVFDQDDDAGRVVVRDPAPPEATWADVRAAADACPSGAIEVAE